jgi:hypothetical protein
MQIGENWSAFLTPAHGSGGAGARQRRAPIGGAANGIPLNARTPSASTPSTKPDAVRIGSAEATGASNTLAAVTSMTNHPMLLEVEPLGAVIGLSSLPSRSSRAPTAFE